MYDSANIKNSDALARHTVKEPEGMSFSSSTKTQSNYGSINSEQVGLPDQTKSGWIYGIYNTGSGAINYGVTGLKWAATSTCNISSTIISTGLTKFKGNGKDKNE